MTNTAIMLANALLAHHRDFCATHDTRPPIIEQCTIAYRQLCEEAGTPGLEIGIGKFLQEVATWCAENGYPPINALAINAVAQMPGESYDLAPGCSILNWENEVIASIVFRGYPATVS